MNFILSANELYILPLSVCITSILENHKDEDVKIFVLQNDFTGKSINSLNQLGIKYKQEINVIKVADNYYDRVPVLRWSKETYYRLLFNELLPKNIDRILYLDCDTIIDKDIKGLYRKDFENFSLIALVENHNIESRQRLGLYNRGKYFQAGVMLFNLEKMRPVLNYEKSLEIIERLGDKLKVVDQDVINVAFDSSFGEIDGRFNNMRITTFKNNWQRLWNKIDKEEVNDTVIFHYATGKPWNKMFAGSAEKVWYKYLKLSPYAYLYNERYNTLKYKILRTGLMKVLFYEYIHITPIINNLFLKVLSKEKYNNLKNFYRKYVK